MNSTRTPYICPAELSGSLDTRLRRLFHNPEKMLSPYLRKGMTVIDLGCGPGYFTLEIAKIVTESGKVIAADLQEKMVEKVRLKIKDNGLDETIRLHQCRQDMTGIEEKVDFILAFWMIHEVPDQGKLFTELKALLNPGGRIFIAEPKFHVTGKAFKEMLNIITSCGFIISEKPRVSISRAVLLKVGNSADNDKLT